MPSAHTYAYHLPTRGRRVKSSYWPCHTSFIRTTVVALSPDPSCPRAARASVKSPVLIPFRYSHGTSSSMALVFRRYGGRILEVNRNRFPCPSTRRSFTRGWRTSIDPL